LVGVETAKALAFAWNKPLIGVNHIEGHIYSPLLLSPSQGERLGVRVGGIKFPAIALIVSGGHTELILMKNHGQYKLLGRTRDDAAGECFDKSAKMLGLGYPGGPLISRLAEKGNPDAFALPRPMTETDNFEFSFSGLKNAIRLLTQDVILEGAPLFAKSGATDRISRLKHKTLSPRKTRGSRVRTINDLAASIEQAIIDVLVSKSLLAARKYHPQSFILAGGVSANKKLRQTLQARLPKSIEFFMPAQEYTQDNAAMIAAAAYFHYNKKNFANRYKLTANDNWELV